MKVSSDTCRLLALLAAGTIALAACQPPAPGTPDTAADKATILATGATWDEEFRASNVDALVALYAEDAMLMPPNAPAAKGKAAIRELLTSMTAESTASALSLEIPTDPATAGASGDLGWRSGTYSFKDSTGQAVDAGKWLEVWQRIGGKWLIIRDTWNSDLPVMPPAVEAGDTAEP